MDDLELRRGLAALENSLGKPGMQPPLIRQQKVRRVAVAMSSTVIAIAAIAAAVVIGVPILQSRDHVGAAARPQGLYVGSGVLGGSPVGQIICAAVEFSDKSYSEGRATAYWWTTNNGQCQSRASGITEQEAAVAIVGRPGSIPGAPNAVRVAFAIRTTAGESVELAFILDPDWNASSDLAVSAWRATDTGKPSLVFEPRSQLAIPGLEDGGPLPTPKSP